MQLIIAEKPKLASNIASSINADHLIYNKEGYYEGNQYIVTSAYGHLFGLNDVDDYLGPTEDGKPRRWTMDVLPFYPQDNKFEFSLKKDPKTKKVDSGVKERFKLICNLAARNDVDSIIHAGDADREGEVIVRLILMNGKINKPVYRLWLPEQTEDVINKALNSLDDDRKYDNLYNEGISRTYIDWLYGINLTRYASIKSNTLLRVGRVIVAIVKAIYDRDMEIKNFKPEKFFSAESKEKTKDCEISLTSKTRFDETQLQDCQKLCDDYNAAGATVTDVTKERKTIDAGKLFNQSGLQAAMGKKEKMTPARTLELAQSLYENGYISYPRTNSEYLGPTEMGRVDGILNALKGQGFKVTQKAGKKSIYDASKIESHSALTPTNKVPTNLSPDEQKVYNAIRDRFVAVFYEEPCAVDRTTITIRVKDENFTVKGDVYVTKGWKAVENQKTNDVILPDLVKGDKVNINFKPMDGMTQPPKHYTVETLGKYMKNPFRDEKKSEVDENDESDYKAIFEGLEIGTEATRAGIIENACATQYIQLKNNTYTILPKGEFLITTLGSLKIDMSKNATARMGKCLKSVYRGEKTIEDAIAETEEDIDEIFKNRDVKIAQSASMPSKYAKVAVCPYCGKDVVETPKAYGCLGAKEGCKFVLWKDNKLLSAIHKSMNKSLMQQFAKNKYASLTGCVGKSGKKFDCYLVLDNTGERLNMNMTFNDPSPKKGEPVGACPKCGKNMYETDNAFVCENAECGATIRKKTAYFDNPIVIDRKKIQEMLKPNGHAVFTVKSQKGKKYDTYLKFVVNGPYINFASDGFPQKK